MKNLHSIRLFLVTVAALLLPHGNIQGAWTLTVDNPTTNIWYTFAGINHPQWYVQTAPDNQGTPGTPYSTKYSAQIAAGGQYTSSTGVTNLSWMRLYQEMDYGNGWEWVNTSNLWVNPPPVGFQLHGSASSDCVVSITIKNNDLVTHHYTIYKNGAIANEAFNGVAMTGYDNIPWLDIGPGQTDVYQFVIACADKDGFYAAYHPYDLQNGYQQLPENTNGVSSNPMYLPTNTAPAVVTTPATPYQSQGGNTNILWTSATATNGAMLSQQIGDSAIVDAIQKASLAEQAGLGALSNAIAGIGSGGTGGGSNISVDLTGLTNALSSINYALTNHGTNISATLLESQTNATAAVAMTDPQMTDIKDATDDWLATMEEPPSFVGGSASPSEMLIEFMGVELNLDPEVRVPGAMGFIKKMLSLLAGLGYALLVSKLYYKSVQTMATAQYGHIPNVQTTFAGFGGNILGVGMQPIITIAFLVIWQVALMAVVSVVTNTPYWSFGESASTASAAVSGLPPVTQYLLNNTIPLDLLIGLAIAAIVSYLTAAKTVMLAVAATRSLAG